ncbi:MAG: PRC-barrel domain-containing protein [Gloeocapsa sp. UFS-A4-WI-NPMV-4B04]|jgi:sporulation protein YlmC with PRC-barrel domain|nr:PRC-barrel domain-containing protein [Gloeocapsa sp. UFS-A4-WI-NPMV-4B04]
MSTREADLEAGNASGQNQEGSNANWPVRILTATSVIGDQVENPKGEHLGRIKDIMLDVQRGSIAYVVLEYGGFMGLREKLFAIPFDALELDQSQQKFRLDVDKEQLDRAPGFDKNHWPETNSHSYGR